MNYRPLPLPPPEPRVPATSKDARKPAISKKIRKAIALLLSAEKPDIETAAKGAGITAYQFRTALKQHHIRAHLFAERRALIEAISAGNPLALKQVRDESSNEMAKVNAVRQLELMRQEASETSRGGDGAAITRPGLIIQIVNQPVAPQPSEPITINPNLPDPGPDLMIEGD